MKLYNHILGIIGIGALAIGSVACTDLDEVTFDRIESDSYFVDESAVQGAVASVYSTATGGFLEYFWYLNEFSADQIAWRSWNGGAWGYDEAAKFVLSTQTWNSESVIIRQAWENAWETIGLCNSILDALTAKSPADMGLTQAKYNSYLAEVRTMRAWAYYNNFEVWGGCLPIATTATPSTIPGSASSNFNESCNLIWQFISTELDNTYKDLPKEDGSNSTRTRMNQGVNRMLKMRLLLNSEIWTGTARYTECAILAQEIINGDYGNYELATDYRKIFNIDNTSCPEVVFAFAMSDGHLTNNNRNTPFLPYNYGDIFGGAWSQGGWNCTCLVPSYDNTGTVVDNCRSEGAKSFVLDYGDKLGAPFARMNDSDVRKQPFSCDEAGNWQGMFLIGAQYDYYTGAPIEADADLQGSPLYYTDQVGTFKGLGRALEAVMSPRWGMTNSGYRVLRYPIYPEKSGMDWRNIAQVEFRLSEVYYTLAECQMRTGSGNAVNTVNEVRQRYFASNPSALNTPGPGFSAFDEDWLLSEWGLEFLDEGRRRRTDLRRFDKFTQGQWWFFGRTTETDRDLPAKRDRKYEWFPLPQVALMVNPGLVQNPNY